MSNMIIRRDDINCSDNDLSDIEEFYLTEIEQIQNADLMFRLQRDEMAIRQEINKTEHLIYHKKQEFKKSY